MIGYHSDTSSSYPVNVSPCDGNFVRIALYAQAGKGIRSRPKMPYTS